MVPFVAKTKKQKQKQNQLSRLAWLIFTINLLRCTKLKSESIQSGTLYAYQEEDHHHPSIHAMKFAPAACLRRTLLEFLLRTVEVSSFFFNKHMKKSRCQDSLFVRLVFCLLLSCLLCKMHIVKLNLKETFSLLFLNSYHSSGWNFWRWQNGKKY